ncbi:hypothetical protein GCM10009576_005930 [Streptomyces rhizosphaericus]|uniref:Uncharacterized protein n=2 Tax=Streptomyces rhizosphaericus TaxID=114699 RepID=A0ABN1NT61_9ACTN
MARDRCVMMPAAPKSQVSKATEWGVRVAPRASAEGLQLLSDTFYYATRRFRVCFDSRSGSRAGRAPDRHPPGQAPSCGAQKKPSFFGEYDTSRFFVCW